MKISTDGITAAVLHSDSTIVAIDTSTGNRWALPKLKGLATGDQDTTAIACTSGYGLFAASLNPSGLFAIWNGESGVRCFTL